MRKYSLEIIVFICGAVVMILELVGSRVLAPFFGNSIFVWTSLIGVILGSLSLGYFWGGKLADKLPNYKVFSIIIFSAAIFTAIIALVKNFVLSLFFDNLDIRLSSVLVSIILFAPASILLGMVSPYAVKLKMQDLNISGKIVGNLYAISTIGSIAGTFFAGFYLISLLGNTKIIIVMAVILVLTSILAYFQNFLKIKIITVILLILCLEIFNLINDNLLKQGKIDIDTLYNRVLIYESKDKKTGRPVRNLSTDPFAIQSSIFIDQDNDLVADYTKYYRLGEYFNPDIKRALMIGGGVYTFPRDFLKRFKTAKIDVVEIDPALTALAEKYFGLKPDPRLKIFQQDGRIFVNSNTDKYDIIYLDAFKSFSVPYHLTTNEMVEKLYYKLNDGGVILLNLISSIEGIKGKFLRAEYATYRNIFPQVYIFPVEDKAQGELTQNIILIAIKSSKLPVFYSENQEYNSYLKQLWTKNIPEDLPVLTDEFAPVDQYLMEVLM